MELHDGGRFDGMNMQELRIHDQVKSTYQYPNFQNGKFHDKDWRHFLGYAYFLLMMAAVDYIPVFADAFVMPMERIFELSRDILEAIQVTNVLDVATRGRIGLGVRNIVCSLLQVDTDSLRRMGLSQFLDLTLEAISSYFITNKAIPDLWSWLNVNALPLPDRITYGLVNFAKHIVTAIVGTSTNIIFPERFYIELKCMIVHACRARRNVRGDGDAVFTREACQDVLLRLRKKLARETGQATITVQETTANVFTVQQPRGPPKTKNARY